MSSPAKTPTPPYYAVVFTSVSTTDKTGYQEMAERMVALASRQPGFLGVESARQELGITVSYWKDLTSISNWKQQADHLKAQQLGRDKWYGEYVTRIALVEREYSFTAL